MPDMQKDNYFTQTWIQPKKNYPKKCVNYEKSKSQQNSVKGQKGPNSAKKMLKTNIKFQYVQKKCHQNKTA